jgi:hypothetical protein
MGFQIMDRLFEFECTYYRALIIAKFGSENIFTILANYVGTFQSSDIFRRRIEKPNFEFFINRKNSIR